MRKYFLLVIIAWGLVAYLVNSGCEKLLPTPPAEENLLEGPLADLTPEQNALHLKGDEAFGQVFTPATGLGSIFVSTSCVSCHRGDGKGHPLTTLTRFGKMTANGFDPMLNEGGPQLQHRAVAGFTPENIPSGATGIAKFNPPAVTGLGFLEAVLDATLIEMADPNDSDGDGISGRVNYVNPPDYFVPKPTHIQVFGKYIGRFGKKAAAIDLQHQTVNAYKQDIGITSDFEMQEPVNYGVANQAIDNIPDPEVAGSVVQSVVFYLRTLKAPIQRNVNDIAVDTGKKVFLTIGCGGCHKPNLKTGKSDIEALSEKEFAPYTDLLLHDMGSELNDYYTEGSAETSEWKTPALWGLGLSKNSQGGTYFLLHDGRAKSINDAIQFHGGEGANSRQKYNQLSETDKSNLIKFLESL